jgi:hypothetical protein
MDSVFVFGSNLAGRHGAGAALDAVKRFGAIYGEPVGRQGNSYAIPTKDRDLNTLMLPEINEWVKDFLSYAREHPMEKFFVTRVGCGLAGYHDWDIAPMFYGAPDNCMFDNKWKEIHESLAVRYRDSSA